MDEENPMTDASNFHSAPEMGRANDDGNEEPVTAPKMEAPQEVATEEKPATTATTITVEEVEETVTPEPVSAIPEAPKPHMNMGIEGTSEGQPNILSPNQPFMTVEQSSHNMQQFQAAPKKKKTSLVATIIIVVAAVLVTAIVVFVVLMLTQNNKKLENNVTNNSNNTTKVEPEYSSIICNKEGSTDERVAAGNAKTIDTTIIATYADDSIEDITETVKYVYTDSSAAKTSANAVKDAYDKLLSKNGFKDRLSDDPFTSEFALSEATLTETHFAEAEELTEKSAPILGLTVGSDGEVETDSDSVKKNYKAAGYSCKSKSE